MKRCPACKQMKLKIETISIGTGAKIVKTVGKCKGCGWQAYPIPERWKLS